MKKIKEILLSALLVLGFGVLAVPVMVHADAKSDACTAIGSDASCTATNGGADVNKVITVVVNLFSLVVGITAVIMIIVGGLKFITSGGDANAVSSAKNTIIYALVGLTIVALSQFIVKFVLNKLQ